MKTLLKIAVVLILGIIAIKLLFGLLVLAVSLSIPLILLSLIGFVIWKIVGGTNATNKTFTTNQPLYSWQNDIFNPVNQYTASELNNIDKNNNTY